MPVFDKSLGLRVYLGLVNNHEIPSEILKHFNTKNLQKLLKLGNNGNEVTIDTIKNNYSVRYALNHLLKNLSLNFDRKIAEFAKISVKYGSPEDPEARVYKLFSSDFKLVYVNPNVHRDFGSSNDPSYYYLFLSLLRSVNLVLVEPSEYNLDQLRVSCENLDGCLFSKESTEYIAHILDHYQRIGAVDLSKHYVFNWEKVHGVSILDTRKLIKVVTHKSDIGFSFSPCGFLIPYHFGVKSYLCEYNVINCNIPLGGASSGSLSICSSILLSGFINSMNNIEKTSKELRYNTKSNKNLKINTNEDSLYNENEFKDLDDVLKFTLEEILTEGCNEFINERIGKVTVAYSVIKHMKFNTKTSSKFSSVDDLRDCLRVSSFIPMVSSDETIVYKGEKCYDGQLSLGKSVGCPETDSRRTVRINPYEFTTRAISREMLSNEFITPNLAPKDQFLVYYVRLKCLIYQLNSRKITLENLNTGDQFPKELVHSINLYNQIASTIDQTSSKYKETRDYSKLSALWNTENFLDLFVLVVKNEVNMDVDKYNVKKYEVTGDMDIMNKLGSSKFFKKPIQTSPITLITYLYMQLSQCNSSELVQIPTNIDSRLLFNNTEHITNPSDLDPTLSPTVSPKANTNKEKSDHLKELLNFIVPPLILIYNYCCCNELVHLNFSKRRMFSVSLYSDEDFYLRFLYDLGRTDAFRWMIQEYIKFENYLYLRILQLNNLHKGVVDTNHWKIDSDEPTFYEAQKKLINDNLLLIEKNKLNEQFKSNSVNFKLFKKLNNAVRNVILSNCVDPHFSHIFSHSHFWNYNKNFKF